MALLAIHSAGGLGIIETPNQKPEVLNKGLNLRFSNWKSITWSPTLSSYVVVGHPQYIAQSENGVLWQYQENPTQQPLTKIRWNCTLNHYIAVGQKGAIAMSDDGVHWKAFQIEGQPNLNHILWCVEKKHYIVIGEKGYIALSPNGIDWQKQRCPVAHHLFDIATSKPWDNKLMYVVISREDDILESEDGMTWTLATKSLGPKEVRSVIYNHRYGLNQATNKAVWKFFTVTANNSTYPGYLYRWYRYYNHNPSTQPNLPPPATYTYPWYSNQVYIQAPSPTHTFSGVNELHWFEEIKLYVGVAETPWVFYNDGFNNLTHLHYEASIQSKEILAAFKPGFCSITLGNIPVYQNDKQTVYIDLANYQ